MTVAPAAASQVPGGIESLRGRKDPEAVRAVAREMESLFAYEMIKAMRATAGTSATGDGFGGDVYGSLFDMELAKVIAAKGLGLQDILLKGLGGAVSSKKIESDQGISGTAAAPPSAAPPSAAPPAGASPASGEAPAFTVPPYVAPLSAASPVVPPAVSGPHTHEPTEENAGPAVASPAVASPPVAAPQGGGSAAAPSAEAVYPIREGGRVSSGFGVRKDPFTGKGRFHHGVDIAAAEGTAIHPVKGGEVTFSGYQKGYGNVVVVDHGGGFVTKYAHNRANRVAVGDRVDPDTVIAEVGSTGRSTGPHLHFEVSYGGEKVHPETVFAGGAKGYG